MSCEETRRILVVGAGEAGRMVAAEIRDHTELDAVVAGFLDDDTALAGRLVEGAPVLGATADLEQVIADDGIDEIVIAVPTAPGRFVREMIKRCRRADVPFKIVPGLMEIIGGAVRIEQIREVEIEDLLGRETVELDVGAVHEALAGRTVLVTGAGGTIGSELCRRLAEAKPGALVLLGRGENRIFRIEEELRASHPDLPVQAIINNLRDQGAVEDIVERIAPRAIYHAAAHKHVHYMERDPAEAVINNVSASRNLVRAAEKWGVERFVFISTDKAADPRGVMGATKRVMELYLRSRPTSPCRFISVRFGNVIGSEGSVVPLFLRQIERGGPVTVSHPGATRFFMTVREAALLVLRASVIGAGGETFILDMGEALNILEIARDIILLSGHEPETEIPIEITGLREGEKLHEALVAADEALMPTGEEKIFLAKPGDPLPDGLEEAVDELVEAARRRDGVAVTRRLSRLLPAFSPPADEPPGATAR